MLLVDSSTKFLFIFFQEISPSCTLCFLAALICSTGSFVSPLKSRFSGFTKIRPCKFRVP